MLSFLTQLVDVSDLFCWSLGTNRWGGVVFQFDDSFYFPTTAAGYLPIDWGCVDGTYWK